MSNVDPQIAAEFTALERLRLAVSQYRAEVGELRKKRGLESTASVPLVDLEELPQEFEGLAKAARQAIFGLGDAPLATPEPPVVAVPAPVVAPIAVTPVAPPPVAPPPVMPPMPIVQPPPVIPAMPLIAAPPVITAPQVTGVAKPLVIAPDESDELTGDTQDGRIKTSPFAPLTPAKPMPQVRVEAGLAARAEPLAPSPVEAPAELKTPLPISAEAQATPRVNLPAATPSAMMRRPGMSPSMQIETLGSFLRRFRLAGE